MSEYIPVDNDKSLVRDRHSSAILNTNLEEKKAFLKDREQTSNIIKIQSQLDIIQTDMQEIKSMLKHIANLKCKHHCEI